MIFCNKYTLTFIINTHYFISIEGALDKPYISKYIFSALKEKKIEGKADVIILLSGLKAEIK